MHTNWRLGVAALVVGVGCSSVVSDLINRHGLEAHLNNTPLEVVQPVTGPYDHIVRSSAKFIPRASKNPYEWNCRFEDKTLLCVLNSGRMPADPDVRQYVSSRNPNAVVR